MHSTPLITEKRKTMCGILITVCGGVMWGFSGACGQYILSKGASSEYLASLRMLFSGLILLAVGFLRKRDELVSLVKNKKDFLRAILFGVFGIITSQYCYIAAISYSNAGTATVLQYLGPVIIMAYTCLAAKRVPTKTETVCVLLAVAGTFLISTHGKPGSLAISHGALIWGLLSAVGFTLYSLIPERIIPKYGAITVSAIGMTSGGIILMLIVRPWTVSFDWSIQAAAAFASIVIFGTVLAYTMFLKGVGIIGASKASIVSCVEPVSAAVISFLWLKSSFAPADIIGFFLIIFTVIIISLKSGK